MFECLLSSWQNTLFTRVKREWGIEPITLPLYTYSPVAVLRSHVSVGHISRTNAEEEPNRLHLSTRGRHCRHLWFFLCWSHLVLNRTELINSSFRGMTNVLQNGSLGPHLSARCETCSSRPGTYLLDPDIEQDWCRRRNECYRSGDHERSENLRATYKFLERPNGGMITCSYWGPANRQWPVKLTVMRRFLFGVCKPRNVFLTFRNHASYI